MRVSIRQPLQPFIRAKAQELGITDEGEVVNYILLQTIEQVTEQLKSVDTGTAKNAVSKKILSYRFNSLFSLYYVTCLWLQVAVAPLP